MVRKLSAEVLGTGLLVYIAVGVATLSFGFGVTGLSFAAGWPRTCTAAVPGDGGEPGLG